MPKKGICVWVFFGIDLKIKRDHFPLQH